MTPTEYRDIRRKACDAFEMAVGSREKFIGNRCCQVAVWLQFWDVWVTQKIERPTGHVETEPIFDIAGIELYGRDHEPSDDGESDRTSDRHDAGHETDAEESLETTPEATAS